MQSQVASIDLTLPVIPFDASIFGSIYPKAPVSAWRRACYYAFSFLLLLEAGLALLSESKGFLRKNVYTYC